MNSSLLFESQDVPVVCYVASRVGSRKSRWMSRLVLLSLFIITDALFTNILITLLCLAEGADGRAGREVCKGADRCYRGPASNVRPNPLGSRCLSEGYIVMAYIVMAHRLSAPFV